MNLTPLFLTVLPNVARRCKQVHQARLRVNDVQLTFIDWVRKYLAHYLEQECSQFHYDLATKVFEPCVRTRNQRIVVEGPRGSAKSVYISLAFALYCACEDVERYILICSDTTPQARKHLAAIKRELEQNPLFKIDYPNVFGRGQTWNESEVVLRNGARIEALGAGKAVRGRRDGEHRPGLIIVDDPEDDESAFSSVKREHRADWFLKGIVSAGSPTTNIILAATRLHNECLCARVSRLPGWKSLRYRAIMRFPERMDLWQSWERLYADVGNERCQELAQEFYLANQSDLARGVDLLWPARFPLLKLMQERATIGHAAFESEYQNNPIDPSKCEFNPECLDGNIWFDDWPTHGVEHKVIACDPSKGRTDKPGDYSSIVRIAKVGPLYYVEADQERRDPTRICEDLLSNAAMFQPELVGIEGDQFQDLLALDVQRLVQERGLMLPVVPVYTEGVAKPVRIRRLSPLISMRALRFKRHSPGTSLLVRQLQEFPHADHDDGPDSLEMADRLMKHLLLAEVRQRQLEAPTQGVIAQDEPEWSEQ